MLSALMCLFSLPLFFTEYVSACWVCTKQIVWWSRVICRRCSGINLYIDKRESLYLPLLRPPNKKKYSSYNSDQQIRGNVRCLIYSFCEFTHTRTHTKHTEWKCDKKTKGDVWEPMCVLYGWCHVTPLEGGVGGRCTGSVACL